MKHSLSIVAVGPLAEKNEINFYWLKPNGEGGRCW